MVCTGVTRVISLAVRLMKFLKWSPLVWLAFLAGGCTPQESATTEDRAPLVPADERSAHFAAVNRQLELGGTLYGYVDIDGDVNKLASSLRTVLSQAAEQKPMLNLALAQDIEGIFADLGLADIKAIGLSSVPAVDGGFRNRVYVYTPQGRHGLMAYFGGPRTLYAGAANVPANTDFYYETEVDLKAVYDALRGVVARSLGEPVAANFEKMFKRPFVNFPAPLSGYDLVTHAKGRMTLAIVVDPTTTAKFGHGSQVFNTSATQVRMTFNGIGALLKPQLDAISLWSSVNTVGGRTDYAMSSLPAAPGWAPVISIQGDSLQIVTSTVMEVTDRAESLATNAAFQAALQQVGEAGNRLIYITPRLLSELRRLPEQNRQLSQESLQGLSFVISRVPQVDRPLIGVRINQPEGVLFISHWHNSLKSDAATALSVNPVTVGLLAAMAVPAFQKVRTSSQSKAITNNLRQLSAAADQYFLETGKTTARYDDLVGSGPNYYIRQVTVVNGEDYRQLVISEQDTTISVTTRSGRVIRYRR